jgi:DNA-binding NtrC family response regulator
MMLRTVCKTVAYPARVLSICDDEGLRTSRDFLLRQDGYQTVSMESNTTLPASLVRSFDLALICRSIDRERAIALVGLLRQYHPGIQILSINPLDSSPETYHPDLKVPSGPQALLDAVRSLVHQPTRPGKAHRNTPQAV